MTQPAIPILDLKAQYAEIKEEIRQAIDRVLEAQKFILGPEVEALEHEIAEYSQCAYGVGVSSGTDALLVALIAIDIRPGDEVVTSAYSFFATAGSIARLGARPVFVDIDERTLNIDPAGVEAAITEKTRAIIPVHLCGQTADMASILEIAERHSLYVIEDAAQAIGADYHGRRAGSLGHMGCFSFFPSKNLGGYGDSGMVVTNDAHLADRLKLLRNHGHRPKYYNQVIGGNFRMDELQAAILRVKFRHLEDWIARRIDHAATYQRFFSSAGTVAGETDSGYICLPTEAGFGRHTYHLYQIRSSSRDDLRRWLQANGIGSEIYYPVPLHLQACFHEFGHQIGDFPRSESAAQNSLALPIYPELTEEMQARIVDTVAEFCAHSITGQATSSP